MLLLSPKEYITRGIPAKVWFYMPEVIDHIMTHTMKDSAFGGNGRTERVKYHQEVLREEMAKGTHDAADLDKAAESFERKKTHRERDSDSGTFDVERYLNGDETPFTDVFTETSAKTSETIIMEMGANCEDRHDTETYRKRHRKAYAEMLRAESLGIPVRVIACMSHTYSEFETARIHYIILKDYTDPIFPEIWGCLRSGATANSASNLVSYTMVGPHDIGNGHQAHFNIDEDFREDEDLVMIDPVRVHSDRAKVI